MYKKSTIEKPNPKKLPVYSYSKFNTYKTCPKQYYFQYIEKKPTTQKPATIFGQFCHEVLENFHKTFLNKAPEDMDLVMQKCFIDAKNNWKKLLTKEQIFEAKDIMQTYLDQLCKSQFPNVVDVEKEIWIPIDDEFILCGFIDRVDREGDKINIMDYKTTKDEKYLKDTLQLSLYSYFFYKEENIKNIKGSFILLKHNMKMLSTEFTVDNIIEAKDKTLKLFRQIQEDKLYRAKPSFLCNYCDFAPLCEEGSNLINGKKTTIGQIKW